MSNITQGKSVTAEKSWEAITIANMNGITTRLHWTNKPYHWHVNNGEEVFVVLDGEVVMHYEINSLVQSSLLKTGDIFHATIGTKHHADPIGEARVLVIEREGSI
ncbi:MAG: cupin [Paraglaciecola sp.]|uniref:cupin n=1 Tax=Paraglaciecola sp. TaxID=1920173 RepID=UPI00329A6F39